MDKIWVTVSVLAQPHHHAARWKPTAQFKKYKWSEDTENNKNVKIALEWYNQGAATSHRHINLGMLSASNNSIPLM